MALLLILVHVYAKVSCQGSPLCEALVAVITPVRLVTHMDAKVIYQGGTLCEALAAVRAPVRLFARVNAKVPRQVVTPYKVLSAVAAPKGALSGMCPLVAFKMRANSCAVATLRALEPLPFYMRSQRYTP